MFYKNIIFIVIFILLSNCTAGTLIKNKPKTNLFNSYTNRGFALIYNEDFYKKRIVSKKMNQRGFTIFQKNLKINTPVKITNILNNKSLIVKVGKNSKYPLFNNSVLSIRVANELDLDVKQPYVEISEINKESIFIVKKAKTYDEERYVAVKAPINNISINDLNITKKDLEKNSNNSFSYSIKVADFYYNETALIMLKRIKNKSPIKSPKIRKITNEKYRVYLGPFSNINSLQKSFNDISILEFENIEIIKND